MRMIITRGLTDHGKKFDDRVNTVKMRLSAKQARELANLGKTVSYQEVVLPNGVTTGYFYVELPFNKVKEIL